MVTADGARGKSLTLLVLDFDRLSLNFEQKTFTGEKTQSSTLLFPQEFPIRMNVLAKRYILSKLAK